MLNMEKEYASLTKGDLDKLGHEIGDHFGHSSLHSMAFDMMRQRLREADRELQASGYSYGHPALLKYRPAEEAAPQGGSADKTEGRLRHNDLPPGTF